MSQFFVLVALFAVAAYSHPTPPTAAEVTAELEASGVSAGAAAGIVAIAEKYKDQFDQGKTDHEAGKAAFDAFHTEVEDYIKTQSTSDQTAYAAYVEKKQAEHKGHGGPHSTTPAAK